MTTCIENKPNSFLIEDLKQKNLWPFPDPDKLKVDEKSFYTFKKETDREWLKDIEDAVF
jgi:hypothetical protein